ncbi:MAG: homoserine dehydrogenase [Candidatus Melainabacteria bacterium]|nr:homoserine dehydrogenase [Candidatus Melainabacteria bacterium]
MSLNAAAATLLPEILSASAPVRIGLIGLGTVGSGTVKLLSRNPLVELVQIAVKSIDKARSLADIEIAHLLTTDAFAVVNNPDVQVVVELVGGIDLAKQWITTALNNKKHVVTANKALIATHGAELFALAKKNGVALLFEASVAGGIPILMPLKMCLAANKITEIAGILNGTTNYILTRMMEDGWDFQTALAKAQALGFAEADPSSDVDGHDAAYKLAILAKIAFQRQIDVAEIFVEGITAITPADIDYAKRFGYTIRLIGLARWNEERQCPELRVHPMLLKNTHPLANVYNEYNAIWVKGDAVGDTMFYGKGAGELPTASAVCADVLALVKDIQSNNLTVCAGMEVFLSAEKVTPLPISETTNRYYIRLNTKDEAGVLAELGKAFGDQGVSLESFLQLPGEEPETASLMLVTHLAQEKNVQQALKNIVALTVTESIGCVLRVL